MQIVLKTFLAVVTLTLTTGVAVAEDCKPAHSIDSLVTPGKLTVAMSEYPPFSQTANGRFGGVDGEILQAIAKAECLELVTIEMDPAATIQYVISGRADVAAGGWYRTEARTKVLGLSYPTILGSMGIFSKEGYSKIEDLMGKKVGTIAGFLWVEDLQKLFGANLQLYPNGVALAQDLARGRIDIAIDAYGPGIYAQQQGAYQGIVIKVAEPDARVVVSQRPAQSGIPYTMGNEGLGNAIDADIEAMHKDGRIAGYLTSLGLDPALADVGEPRLVE